MLQLNIMAWFFVVGVYFFFSVKLFLLGTLVMQLLVFLPSKRNSQLPQLPDLHLKASLRPVLTAAKDIGFPGSISYSLPVSRFTALACRRWIRLSDKLGKKNAKLEQHRSPKTKKIHVVVDIEFLLPYRKPLKRKSRIWNLVEG